MSDPVSELLALLGAPVTLINWPRGVKGSAMKWKHLRHTDMTPSYLAKLAAGNIGVALGEVSGGLCAIDLDDDELVQPFLTLNPHLAGTLQTHGARGRVFWLRFNGDYPQRTLKLKTHASAEVGEFRSNGSQSIVWGIHPATQRPYQFVVKQPAVAVEFSAITWPTSIFNPPTLQRDRETDVINSVSLSLCLSASLSLCLSVKSVAEAVEMSLPSREHQNNAALFKLARALMAVEAGGKPLSLAEKRDAFAQWYEAAASRQLLREGQTRDDYLVEFMNATQKAKTPLGESPAEQAWKRAQSEPLPPEASVFESKEGKLLVALCWQLHLRFKGEPWFLATRTVARLTGRTHTTAATWLSALCELAVIEVVHPHTPTKATRFRYLKS